MKKILNLLFLIPLFLFSQQSNGQKSVNKLYKKYKYEQDVMKISLPGFLIKMGSGIANGFVDEPEVKEVLKFAKKIGKIKVLTMENGNTVREADIQQMLYQSRKNNYNDLVQVREHGSRVNFLIRQGADKTKKGKSIPGKIKNLLLVVSEEDTFTLVSMKSKFTILELSELINKLMRSQWENDKEILPKKESKPIPRV